MVHTARKVELQARRLLPFGDPYEKFALDLGTGRRRCSRRITLEEWRNEIECIANAVVRGLEPDRTLQGYPQGTSVRIAPHEGCIGLKHP